VSQVSLVQNQPVGVGVSLAGLAVDDEDAGDLRQLGEDDLVLVLDAADDAVLQQVAVPLVLLAGGQFFDVYFGVLLQIRIAAETGDVGHGARRCAGDGDAGAVADHSRW